MALYAVSYAWVCTIDELSDPINFELRDIKFAFNNDLAIVRHKINLGEKEGAKSRNG